MSRDTTTLTADDRLALIKTFSFVRERRSHQKNLDDLADRFDRHANKRMSYAAGPSQISLFSDRVNTPLTLQVALAHARLRHHFRVFVEQAYAVENLNFIEAFEDLDCEDPDWDEMLEIIMEYCSLQSPSPINLPHTLTKEIAQARLQNDAGKLFQVLAAAKLEIMQLLQANFFHRFLSLVVDVQDDPMLIDNVKF